MRVFLAINPVDDVRARLFDDAAALRLAAPDLRWVRQHQLHVTLRFLGSVDERDIDRVRDALATVAARRPRFPATLAGVGGFPNIDRPRVVWIGMRIPRSGYALAEDVEDACRLLGFERDARGFTPHLTLARARGPIGGEQARSLSAAALAMHNEYTIDVQAVDLMGSELTSRGPEHRLLGRLPLTA